MGVCIIKPAADRHDGLWRMHAVCKACDGEVYHRGLPAPSCCPHCGHSHQGQAEIEQRPMRWIKRPHKWWEYNKRHQGRWVGLDDEKSVHEEG